MFLSWIGVNLRKPPQRACTLDRQSPFNFKAVVKGGLQCSISASFWENSWNQQLEAIFFFFLNYFCNYCYILWAVEYVFLIRSTGEFAQGRHEPN